MLNAERLFDISNLNTPDVNNLHFTFRTTDVKAVSNFSLCYLGILAKLYAECRVLLPGLVVDAVNEFSFRLSSRVVNVYEYRCVEYMIKIVDNVFFLCNRDDKFFNFHTLTVVRGILLCAVSFTSFFFCEYTDRFTSCVTDPKMTTRLR